MQAALVSLILFLCVVCSSSEPGLVVDAETGTTSSFPNDVIEERYKYNIRTVEGTHPSIKPLERQYKANSAMSAKFR